MPGFERQISGVRRDCFTTTVPQQLYRNNCTATTVPQQLYSNNCTATTVQQQLYHNNCTTTTSSFEDIFVLNKCADVTYLIGNVIKRHVPMAVIVLTFNSENLSSNPTDVYKFSAKMLLKRTKINKKMLDLAYLKRGRVGPFKKWL